MVMPKHAQHVAAHQLRVDALEECVMVGQVAVLAQPDLVGRYAQAAREHLEALRACARVHELVPVPATLSLCW